MVLITFTSMAGLLLALAGTYALNDSTTSSTSTTTATATTHPAPFSSALQVTVDLYNCDAAGGAVSYDPSMNGGVRKLVVWRQCGHQLLYRGCVVTTDTVPVCTGQALIEYNYPLINNLGYFADNIVSATASGASGQFSFVTSKTSITEVWTYQLNNVQCLDSTTRQGFTLIDPDFKPDLPDCSATTTSTAASTSKYHSYFSLNITTGHTNSWQTLFYLIFVISYHIHDWNYNPCTSRIWFASIHQYLRWLRGNRWCSVL